MARFSDLDIRLQQLGWDEARRRRATVAEAAAAVLQDHDADLEQARRTFGLMLEASTVVLLAAMADDGIPDPLGAQVTVYALLADLFHRAGARVPAWVAERIG